MSSVSSEITESTSEEILPAQEAPNADINDDEMFSERAILFRFSREKNEWINRGSGVLKILKDKDSGLCRILMRQNLTYVVRANHQIPYMGSLHSLQGSNREFTWTAYDFADTKETETRELFAVRFPLPDIANKFKTNFENGQSINKKYMESER